MDQVEVVVNNNGKIRKIFSRLDTLQNSRFFFLKISKEIGKAWSKSLSRKNTDCFAVYRLDRPGFVNKGFTTWSKREFFCGNNAGNPEPVRVTNQNSGFA